MNQPSSLRRALLISPDGMLGRAMAIELRCRDIAFDAVTFPAFDITSDASVAGALETARYGLVINCAAWTDVDAAETREAEANAVNADGPGRLARACRASGALLLHFSTDYVFDGKASAPYATGTPRAPLNAYGRTKALGEANVVDSGCDYAIVRTSWLYAPWGKNFVRTIADLCEQRDVLRVVNDQRGRPTSAESLARRSLAIARRALEGSSDRRRTYHVTDGGECSWWELAVFIATSLGVSTRVEPCTTAEFPRPAIRPEYSVLDISETESLLGPAPTWKEEVARVLACREHCSRHKNG